MSDKRQIVWTGTWSSRFTNVRHYELLRRFSHVRQYRFPHVRVLSRAYGGLQRSLLRLLSHRYAYHYCAHLPLLDAFEGPTIADVDDPRFTPDEIARLNDSRVVAVVTSTPMLRRRFLDGGLTKPAIVMPSGYSRRDLRPERIAAIQRSSNPSGRPVVGYVSFRLTLGSGNPYSDVDLLTEAMQRVWAEVPEVELWLVGDPDRRLRAYAGKQRARVRLTGLIPHDDLLNWIANFTIAAYCRQTDSGGWFRVKLIEYMGCGIPIVATDLPETRIVREADAGMVSSGARGFADHLLTLLHDSSARGRHGEQGARFATEYDWDALARRYEREVFHAYCPT